MNPWIFFFFFLSVIIFMIDYRRMFSEQEREAGLVYCIIAFVITVVCGAPGFYFLLVGIGQSLLSDDPEVHGYQSILLGVLLTGVFGFLREYLLPKLWGTSVDPEQPE